MQELKVGVLTFPPFINECWRTCKNAGFIMDTVKLLCSTYNYSCVYIDSQDAGIQNMSWTALVENVRDGLYDTTMPIISATPERYAMVDFSHTVFYMELFFVFRTPQPPQMSINRLMALQWNVWLCLILCMTIIGVILTLADIHTIGKKCFSLIFWNCLDAFALFTNQYPEMHLAHAGSQILMGFWAVSVLIVSGIYSGNLLNFLLRSKLDYPFHDFNTFIECLDQKECQLVLTSNSSSFAVMLNNTEVEQFARIMKALAKNNPTVSPSPANIIKDLLHVKDRYLVWFTTQAAFASITNDNVECLYTTVRSGYYDWYHFPLKKHSKFKKNIDQFALNLRATGWHAKLFTSYVKTNTICKSEKTNDGKPMPLSSMFSLLFILAIGYLFSSLIFFLEKFFKFLKR